MTDRLSAVVRDLWSTVEQVQGRDLSQEDFISYLRSVQEALREGRDREHGQ